MIKILFVCHGNICRSPMAEFVLNDMAKKADMQDILYAASAATSTEEIGNPVHYGTRRKLAQYNISTDGKIAIRLNKSDYTEYDYIIGMDTYNIRNIINIIGADPDNKVIKLLDICGRGGDVADPWYTGDFDATYRDIYDGCKAIINDIKRRGKI